VVAFGSLRRVVSIKLDTSDQGGLTGFLVMGGLVGKPSSTPKFKALWTTDGGSSRIVAGTFSGWSRRAHDFF